jgi:anti-sigma factor RsiW
MDCSQCTENLTAFLDGELTASDSEQMRTHLDGCLSCADELRSLKEAAEFVGAHHKDLKPRPESWNMVRARLSADTPARSRFFAPGRWRLALASLAIAVALGIGYLRYHQVQNRNLENYISRYIQDREARSHAQSIQWNAQATSLVEIPDADNPFIETGTASAENPFRSEFDTEEE